MVAGLPKNIEPSMSGSDFSGHFFLLRGGIYVKLSQFLLGTTVGVLGMYFGGCRRAFKQMRNESRVFELVENSKDIMYICDIKPELKFHYLSPSIEDILGKGIVEQSFKNPQIIFERIHPDDNSILFKKVNGELDYNKPIVQRWKDEYGEYHWFEEYCTPIKENGVITGIQGIIRNVDDKMKLQKKLEYKANYDSLTGVYNRDYFERCMDRFDREDQPVGIVLCDMDGLKSINDQYGHKKGDEVLQAIGSILNQFSSHSVSVMRLGGDEFAILVEGSQQEAEDLCRKIHNAFEDYNKHQSDIPIQMSVGMAHTLSSQKNMERLYISGDQNMYSMKDARKSV